MIKRHVIERLCQLSTEVVEKKFKWKILADCFCGAYPIVGKYEYDEEILEFIEKAVRKALKNKRRKKRFI